MRLFNQNLGFGIDRDGFFEWRRDSDDDEWPSQFVVIGDVSVAMCVVPVHKTEAPSFSIHFSRFIRCQALSNAVKAIEQDSSMQALVLQSSNPQVFSAGLDLMEMHNPDPTRLRDFWSSFQQLYLDLYGSRLACMAAIEGHAPAAGCMLTLSCDYRIMAASDEQYKPTIGLNEAKLGIVAPPWLGKQFMDTVGRRQAELGLSLGLLYSPEQALEIGLVDEVVPKDNVRQKAQEAAVQWAQIPPQARVASKMLLRKDRLDHLKATREQDIQHFTGFVTNDKVRKSLSAYLEMLAKKNKK